MEAQEIIIEEFEDRLKNLTAEYLGGVPMDDIIGILHMHYIDLKDSYASLTGVKTKEVV